MPFSGHIIPYYAAACGLHAQEGIVAEEEEEEAPEQAEAEQGKDGGGGIATAGGKPWKRGCATPHQMLRPPGPCTSVSR